MQLFVGVGVGVLSLLKKCRDLFILKTVNLDKNWFLSPVFLLTCLVLFLPHNLNTQLFLLITQIIYEIYKKWENLSNKCEKHQSTSSQVQFWMYILLALSLPLSAPPHLPLFSPLSFSLSLSVVSIVFKGMGTYSSVVSFHLLVIIRLLSDKKLHIINLINIIWWFVCCPIIQSTNSLSFGNRLIPFGSFNTVSGTLLYTLK